METIRQHGVKPSGGRSALRALGIAAAVTGLAWSFAAWLQPATAVLPFALLSLAVLAGAQYGFWPGLLATALGTVALATTFALPGGALSPDPVFGPATFAVLGLIASWAARRRVPRDTPEDAGRERLHAQFMEAPALIATFQGPEHVCAFANQRFRCMVGGREVLGRPLGEALPELAAQPVGEEPFRALMDRVYAAGEPEYGSEVPTRLQRAGNARAQAGFYNFICQPTWDAKGTVDGVMLFATDVTDQVEARQRAERLAAERAELLAREQAAQQRFAQLVEDLDAIVWEADAATRQFTFVSQYAGAVLGYPMSQWLEEPDFWQAHLHPDDRENALARCRQAMAECRNYEHEYRMVAADGRVVWLFDSVRVLCDDEGRATQLRGVMMDFTHRKRAEQELEIARTRALESEVEKKRFYNEVLCALTMGKFHLCEAGDVPLQGELVFDAALSPQGDYSEQRRIWRQAAVEAGMNPDDADDFVLAAGEAASNAIKHAVQGRVAIYRGEGCVIARVSDHGTGIRPQELPGAVLLPGYSTKMSLGMGYTMMLDLVDKVWLATGPEGTTVQLQKCLPVEEDLTTALQEAWDRL